MGFFSKRNYNGRKLEFRADKLHWLKMVKKKLYRSKKNRMIGGVCSGIAEYLDTDPTIVRLIWAVAVLLWGVGFFAYLVAWIIIPEKK